MDAERNRVPAAGGKFLPEGSGEAKRKSRASRRWAALVWLLLGDGLLIYMILGGLIDQGYGVVILAGISAYFGNRLNGKEHGI